MARFDHSPHATVVDESLFAFVTEHEVRTAMRLRYPVSVLSLLPEVEGAGERAAPSQVGDQIARALSVILRKTDLIRRSPDTASLHVLVVGAPLDALPGIIQRISEEVDHHRFLIDGEGKTVTLGIGGACFPTTASTARELLSRADTLAAEAWRDEAGRSRYRLR